MAIAAGTRLGPYEILAPIGAGGMGEVYRARDTRLERQVAIKILPAEFAQNRERRIRFEREARTISQFSHPHICTLFDVGENYIVMELLEGESLAQRIASGPLPLADVCKYGSQIAEALGRAHRAGIVHRDLKPGNIMITKSGAKLLDFGLAKATASSITPQESAATVQRPLTAEGMVVGTFQYMAPEQLAGDEPDARTDIFALGAVLYEMATGRRAFEGKSKTSLIAAIISGEPLPMTQLQPMTPPALEHLVRKCLEKDPDDRWQNASDVAEELRWIGQSGSQAGVAVPVASRRKMRERILMGITAVALILGTYFLAHRRAAAPLNHLYTIPGDAADYSDASLIEVSPDGRHFLIWALQNGATKVWLRDTGSMDTRAVAGTEGANWLPQFSDDGRYIYFFTDKYLNRVPLNGGRPEHLFPRAFEPWSWLTVNAGGVVLFSKNTAIMKWSDGDRAPVTLLRPDVSKGEVGFQYPQFLPDGRHFLVSLRRRSNEGIESGSVVLGSLESNDRTPILDDWSRAVYAPPGYLLFGRRRKLFAVPFDANRLKMSGPESIVADDVYIWGDFVAFSVSNEGTLSYRPSLGESQLVWKTGDGKETPFRQPARYEAGAISPDGKSVAISIGDTELKFAIWLLGVDRPTSSRITFEPDNAGSPIWIDDRRIAYTYSMLGSLENEIRTRSIDGSSDAGETLVRGVASYPIGAVGGNLLYLQRRAGEKRELWEVSLDRPHTTRPVLRAPYDVDFAMLSPDGKWLLYAADESGRDELYLCRFPNGGEKTQITTTGIDAGLWNANSKSIAYARGNELDSVRVLSDGGQPLIGEPKRLFAVTALRAYRLAPDGRYLIWRSAQQGAPPTIVMTNWLETLHKSAQ